MRRGTSPMRKGPWTVAAPEQLGRGWQRAGVPNDSEGDRRCGEGNGEGVKRRERAARGGRREAWSCACRTDDVLCAGAAPVGGQASV